jgi:hypothetical protein
MYETTPIWVKGTVVAFERRNPHSIMTLEDRGEEGRVLRWAVEGPPQTALERTGIGADAPKVGDAVEFCAFPYKPSAELSRLYPGVDFSARRSSDGSTSQTVAGHVMVMADGEKRFWEPHGIISECIRSADDQRRSWLALLDTNPLARQAWCEQRRYAIVQSNESLQELVAEIDSSIEDPCR